MQAVFSGDPKRKPLNNIIVGVQHSTGLSFSNYGLPIILLYISLISLPLTITQDILAMFLKVTLTFQNKLSPKKKRTL